MSKRWKLAILAVLIVASTINFVQGDTILGIIAALVAISLIPSAIGNADE